MAITSESNLPKAAIAPPPEPNLSGTNLSEPNLYEQDFHAWTQQQVAVLQQQCWQNLDREHLIEEIDSLGRQQRQELENRLGVLLGHLLKWKFQPQQRSRSWQITLREQRRRIRKLIEQNPSLQPYIAAALQDGYENAIDLAIGDPDLPDETFPVACPYSFEQAMDPDFFPGVAL